MPLPGALSPLGPWEAVLPWLGDLRLSARARRRGRITEHVAADGGKELLHLPGGGFFERAGIGAFKERTEPGDARRDAQFETTVDEEVDGRRVLGNADRLLIADRDDGGAQFDPAGVLCSLPR